MLVILDNSVNHYEAYKDLLLEFGDTSCYSYAEHQNHVHRSQLWYGKKVFLFVKNGKIVGTCSVIFDYKPFHSAFAVHVEDVVIHPKLRGEGFGREMLQELHQRIEEYGGCYKMILDCEESNIPFYESAGFSRYGEVEMRLDLSIER